MAPPRHRAPIVVTALFTLIIAVLCLLAPVTHAAGAPPATVSATPHPAAPVKDDDDDLVYHWQDARYSHELGLQINGAAVFLALVAVGSQLRASRVRGRAR